MCIAYFDLIELTDVTTVNIRNYIAVTTYNVVLDTAKEAIICSTD
jgi:hypothetical protein